MDNWGKHFFGSSLSDNCSVTILLPEKVNCLPWRSEWQTVPIHYNGYKSSCLSFCGATATSEASCQAEANLKIIFVKAANLSHCLGAVHTEIGIHYGWITQAWQATQTCRIDCVATAGHFPTFSIDSSIRIVSKFAEVTIHKPNEPNDITTLFIAPQAFFKIAPLQMNPGFSWCYVRIPQGPQWLFRLCCCHQERWRLVPLTKWRFLDLVA